MSIRGADIPDYPKTAFKQQTKKTDLAGLPWGFEARGRSTKRQKKKRKDVFRTEVTDGEHAQKFPHWPNVRVCS